MRFRDAKRLNNRDQISVRISPGRWVGGYVLGSPVENKGRILVPTVSEDGFKWVDHTDVK